MKMDKSNPGLLLLGGLLAHLVSAVVGELSSNFPKTSPLLLDVFHLDTVEVSLGSPSGLFSATPGACTVNVTSGVSIVERPGQFLVSTSERPATWTPGLLLLTTGPTSLLTVDPKSGQMYKQTVKTDKGWLQLNPVEEVQKPGPITVEPGNIVSHVFRASDNSIGVVTIGKYKDDIKGFPVWLSLVYTTNNTLLSVVTLKPIPTPEAPTVVDEYPPVSSTFLASTDPKSKKTTLLLYLYQQVLPETVSKIQQSWSVLALVNTSTTKTEDAIKIVGAPEAQNPFGPVLSVVGAGLSVFITQVNPQSKVEVMAVCRLTVSGLNTPSTAVAEAINRSFIFTTNTPALVQARESQVVARRLMNSLDEPSYKKALEMDPSLFVEILRNTVTEGSEAGTRVLDIFACTFNLNEYKLKICRHKQVSYKPSAETANPDRPLVSVSGSSKALRIVLGDKAIGITIDMDYGLQSTIETPSESDMIVLPGTSHIVAVTKDQGNKLYQQNIKSIKLQASKLFPSTLDILVSCAESPSTAVVESVVKVQSTISMWNGITKVEPETKLPRMAAYPGDKVSFTIDSTRYTGNDPKLRLKTGDANKVTGITGKNFPHKLIWTLPSAEDKIKESRVYGRFGLARTDKNRMHIQQCTENIHGGVHCRPTFLAPLPLDFTSVITTCESPNQETLVCAVYNPPLKECILYVATLRGFHNILIGKSRIDRLVVKNPKDSLLHIAALLQDDSLTTTSVKMFRVTTPTQDNPKIEAGAEIPSNFTFCPKLISDVIYTRGTFKVVSGCSLQSPQIVEATFVEQENKPLNAVFGTTFTVESDYSTMEVKDLCMVGNWGYISLKSRNSLIVDIYMLDNSQPHTRRYFMSPALFSIGKFDGKMHCLRHAGALVVTRNNTMGYIFNLDPQKKSNNRLISTFDFTAKAPGVMIEEWNMKVIFRLETENANDVYVGLTDRTVVELAVLPTATEGSTYSIEKETAVIGSIAPTLTPSVKIKDKFVTKKNATLLDLETKISIEGPVSGAFSSHPGAHINLRVAEVKPQQEDQPLVQGTIGLESIYAKDSFVATFDSSPETYQAFLEIFSLESMQASYRSRFPVVSLSPQLDFAYLPPATLVDGKQTGVFIVAQESDLGKGGVQMLYWTNGTDQTVADSKYIMSQAADIPRPITRIKVVMTGTMKTELRAYVFSLAKHELTIQGIKVSESEGRGSFGIESGYEWIIKGVRDFDVVLLNENSPTQQLCFFTLPFEFSADPSIQEYRLDTKQDAKVSSPTSHKIDYEGKTLAAVRLSADSAAVFVNTLSPIIYEIITVKEGTTETNKYYKLPGFDGRRVQATKTHFIFQVESADNPNDDQRDTMVLVYKRIAAGGSPFLFWSLDTAEEIRVAIHTCVDESKEACIFSTQSSTLAKILVHRTSSLTVSRETDSSFKELGDSGAALVIKGLMKGQTESVNFADLVTQEEDPDNKDDDIQPTSDPDRQNAWYNSPYFIISFLCGLVFVVGIVGLVSYLKDRRGIVTEEKSYMSVSFSDNEHNTTIDHGH